MKKMTNYLFTSERLGFRNWRDSDLDKLYEMNSSPAVMEFFPSTQTREHCRGFIQRMQQQYAEIGYCYFAVETLAEGRLIGFIGISKQTYEAEFTPCTDIGWRLLPSAWGKGYATEGAKRCLEYAFETLGLEEVVAVAPAINAKSISVMQKIGLSYYYNFDHSLMPHDERLRNCVLWGRKR